MFGRRALEMTSRRLPLLRRLPIVRIIFIAELALIARRHLQHLTKAERRRMWALVRRGRAMTAPERDELRRLVAKLEPRAFAGSAAARFSPVPLPRRLTRARY